MRFYAERPGRAARQVLGDALVLGWLAVVGFVALAAYELLLALQAPGRALVDAGGAIGGTFDDAARTAGGVPLVGDDLARALDGGGAAGRSLADAGRAQVETVAAVALGTAVGIALLGALPVLLVWVPLRVRYARAAACALALREGGADLLALRALARRPVRALRRVAPDPAAAWRRDDRAMVHGLAALELAALGLRAARSPAPERGAGAP